MWHFFSKGIKNNSSRNGEFVIKGHAVNPVDLVVCSHTHEDSTKDATLSDPNISITQRKVWRDSKKKLVFECGRSGGSQRTRDAGRQRERSCLSQQINDDENGDRKRKAKPTEGM